MTSKLAHLVDSSLVGDIRNSESSDRQGSKKTSNTI